MQPAAELVALLDESAVMAALRKVIGRRQSRRPTANDRHAPPSCRRDDRTVRLCRFEIAIGHELFELTDRGGTVVLAATTSSFANLGADATEDGGQSDVALDGFDCCPVVAFGHVTQHVGHVHVRGAGVLAWRVAIAGMVGEQQFDAGTTEFVNRRALRLNPHTIAHRRAARGHHARCVVDAHQTTHAGMIAGQIFVATHGGNVDAELAGRVEHGLAVVDFDARVVNPNLNH